jgi:hypothetical protein
MEQNKTDQILEVLLARMDANKAKLMARRKADKAQSEAKKKADRAEIMAKMDSNQEMIARMMASQGRTDANLEEMKATTRRGEEEMIKAIKRACRESTKVCPEKTKALPEMTESCPVMTRACLEKKEPTPEETEAVEKPQEVAEGATDEQAFGATEDRAGKQHLAVRSHRQLTKWAQDNDGPQQTFATVCEQLKTQTKRNGESRQECAAAVGRPTHHTVPAMRKGGLRKGPGRNHCSGIRGRAKTSSNGMRKRTWKWRLERKEADREIIRQSLGREISKRIVESSIRL